MNTLASGLYEDNILEGTAQDKGHYLWVKVTSSKCQLYYSEQHVPYC